MAGTHVSLKTSSAHTKRAVQPHNASNSFCGSLNRGLKNICVADTMFAASARAWQNAWSLTRHVTLSESLNHNELHCLLHKMETQGNLGYVSMPPCALTGHAVTFLSHILSFAMGYGHGWLLGSYFVRTDIATCAGLNCWPSSEASKVILFGRLRDKPQTNVFILFQMQNGKMWPGSQVLVYKTLTAVRCFV